MGRKPRSPSEEIQNLTQDFDNFDSQIKEMTVDAMNKAPLQTVEPQTKLSQKDLAKSKDIVLKPKRVIAAQDKFNEKFRDDYNYSKEKVQFIAENRELIGQNIEIWTRPFGGVAAEFWEVPVNKPVWGPRYLAEQITKARYHKMSMNENTSIGGDHMGQYTGQLVVESTVNRLDAVPVNQGRSVFMGG